MNCPRCDFENIQIVNGKRIKQVMSKCIMCNLPLVENQEQENIIDNYAYKIKYCMDQFYETGNSKELFVAGFLYMRAMASLIETEDETELPIRPEVSE